MRILQTFATHSGFRSSEVAGGLNAILLITLSMIWEKLIPLQSLTRQRLPPFGMWTRLFSDHWSLQNCSFYKETEERAEFWWIHAVGCFLGPAKRHQWQAVQWPYRRHPKYRSLHTSSYPRGFRHSHTNQRGRRRNTSRDVSYLGGFSYRSSNHSDISHTGRTRRCCW